MTVFEKPRRDCEYVSPELPVAPGLLYYYSHYLYLSCCLRLKGSSIEFCPFALGIVEVV